MRNAPTGNTVYLSLSIDKLPLFRALVRVYHFITIVSNGSGVGNAVESYQTKSLLSNRAPVGSHSYGVASKDRHKVHLVTIFLFLAERGSDALCVQR